MAILPTFEQIGAKFLVEFNRLKARVLQLGDEEALIAQFQNIGLRGKGKISQQGKGLSSRGRGRCNTTNKVPANKKVLEYERQ